MNNFHFRDTTDIIEPQLNDSLRTVLNALNRALELKDSSLTTDIIDLANRLDDLDEETIEDLATYGYGTIENNQETNDSDYSIYTPSDVERAKKSLEKIAYGNFNEAMLFLEHDLSDIDPTIKREEKYSNVFNADFFTKKQQKVWNELRKPVVEHEKYPNKDLTNEAMASVKKLRDYQQNYYGQLQPVGIVSYVKIVNGDTHGFTARIVNKDGSLELTEPNDNTEDLNQYLKTLGKQRRNPKQWKIPKEINGYIHTNTEIEFLFPFEIFTFSR